VKLNKKMIIMLASVIGVVVVLIIIIMLFVGGGNKKLSYDKIEEKIIAAGESYFTDNEDKLPKVGTISVDVDTLVKEGYLNDLSKYTDDNVTCDGTLYVTKNPSGYAYRANLDCGKKYTTNSLADVIIGNGVVTNGSGLYEENQVNPNDNLNTHKVYVFKGDNVHNYVKIGDFYWEIIKVYENGEIAVLGDPELLTTIWDNRYNIDNQSYNGINEYEVSRLKDTINSTIVEDEEGYLNIKKVITTHTACIGKRGLDDNSKDGSTECSETLENQYFSLLPVYDYMNASLDENCSIATDSSCYNYNFLASYDESWTITGVLENTQDVYYIDISMDKEEANTNKDVRLYVHLDASVTYVSGSGTYEDPYIVK